MTEQRSVLIVDDEKLIRLNLGIFLEDMGFSVLEAANGLEALNVFDRERPDLVLTDLRMPKMDGLSLISALTKKNPDTPVVVISGIGKIQEAIEAIRRGAWDYLTKPLQDQDSFAIVIERVLERARLINENRRYREHLEELVLERTAELETANSLLQEESAERKQAEQQIHLLNHALDHVREAAFLIELDEGTFLRVNQEACRSLEYTREELTGMSALNIDPNFSSQALKENIAELLRQGSMTFETCHRTKSGKTFPVELTATIFEYDGIKYSLSLVRDITERKQAERQLELLNHALDQIHEGAFLIDEQKRFTYVNQEACRSLEYSMDELLGMTVLDIDALFTPELAVEHLADIDRQGTLTFETQHRTKSDRIFPVEITTSVFEHGGSRYYLSLVRNIAERKQLEDALAVSEQEFRSLAENSPDSIIRYDLEHRILYLNDGLVRELGLADADEVIGKLPIEIWPDGRFAAIDEGAQRAIKTGEAQSVELIWTSHTGQVVSGQILVVPERDVRGQIIGTLAFGRDITGLKKMEESLRESEERFRLLVELSPDLIFIRHKEWIVYANPAAARLVGADSAAELIGRSVLGFALPEQREELRALIAANDTRPAGEVTVPYDEGTLLRLDGSRVPIELTAVRFNYQGMECSQQIMRDISERKQAEDALKRREQEFRTLAENSPDNIVRYDTTCRVVYTNTVLKQTLGISAFCQFGKTPIEIFPNGEFREYHERIAQVVASGEDAGIDIVSPDTGEGEQYHNIRFVAERGADGEVTGVLAIGRDITERKRQEQQLALLSSCIDTMHDAVYLGDAEGRFVYVNESACRMLGYSRDTLLTMGVPDIDPTVTWEQCRAAFVSLSHGAQFDLAEYTHKTSDGRLVPVDATSKFIEHDGHQYVLSLARNITERKQTEEMLFAKQQKLTDMAMELSLTEERERRRIAAEIHDSISQTLLLGKIKLRSLIANNPDFKNKNELDEILRLQDEMIRSVRSLTQQLSPPILSVAGLEDALEWLGERMMEDYGLQVELVDDKSRKPLSEDIRAIVYQSCRELLINVAKHAETESARVIIGSEKNRFYLTVEDRGAGFALSGIVAGGFGLFSIKERIKHLGGEVLIESAQGRGTRVTLWMELALETENPA